jgi:hypothetical protein
MTMAQLSQSEIQDHSDIREILCDLMKKCNNPR